MDTITEMQSVGGLALKLHREDEWVWRVETSALAERGMPDFAITAQPYEVDPYTDMDFDATGMADLLDQIVIAWQKQPIRAGDPVEISDYDGWTILVDPIADDPVVDEMGFAGIVLRWKPAPAPPPEPIDVNDEWSVKLQLGIIGLEARTPDSIVMQGLEREDVTFVHDQRFGPLTAWVVANARAMLALEDLDILIARFEAAAAAEDPRVAEVALSMVAEWSLREQPYSAIRRMSHHVVRRITAQDEWKDEVKHRADDLGRSRSWTRGYLNDLLVGFVRNTLVACALQDVMSDSLTRSATGVWRSILSPHEDFAGDLWRCSDNTTSILKEFFADLDEDRLVEIMSAIDGLHDTGESWQCVELIGTTLVRKSAPPPLAEFVGDGLRDLLQYRCARSLMDQVARLIAGLAEPPESMDAVDVTRLRDKLSETIGVRWTKC